MPDPLSRNTPALLAGGALIVATTTAAEVLTAPYGELVSAYPANGAVHLVKVAGVALWIVGMLGLLTALRDRLGRPGSLAVGALIVGTCLGAVPYSLVEASLDPGLRPAVAVRELDAIYADHPWIGWLAMVGLPLVVVGVVTLGIVVLRRRLLASSAPIVSLASIPLGIAAAALGEATGWPIPHPPAWIFLGLASYGVALAAAPRQDVRRSPRSSMPSAR